MRHTLFLHNCPLLVNNSSFLASPSSFIFISVGLKSLGWASCPWLGGRTVWECKVWLSMSVRTLICPVGLGPSWMRSHNSKIGYYLPWTIFYVRAKDCSKILRKIVCTISRSSFFSTKLKKLYAILCNLGKKWLVIMYRTREDCLWIFLTVWKSRCCLGTRIKFRERKHLHRWSSSRFHKFI